MSIIYTEQLPTAPKLHGCSGPVCVICHPNLLDRELKKTQQRAPFDTHPHLRKALDLVTQSTAQLQKDGSVTIDGMRFRFADGAWQLVQE
jgi:hypothetical protein